MRPSIKFPKWQRLGTKGRRSGMAIVYVALGMVTFLGLAAYTIDLSILRMQKAQVQKAADTAALAGAFQLANFQTQTYAGQMAAYYAGLQANGGYVNGTNNCRMAITYPAKNEAGVIQPNWYRVDISRPERTFFGAIFGTTQVKVGAFATALYTTLAPIDIKGLGTYGISPGPVNLSLFGPYGYYSFGDCYSVHYLDDHTTINPLYSGKGYDFSIIVPTTFRSTTVEIFDPDCYNDPDKGSTTENPDAGGDDGTPAHNPLRLDEYRTPTGGNGTAADATTTLYSLYWDHNTPNDPTDDVLIGSHSWGHDSTTDMQWISAFTFDRATYSTGNFRLNVLSTAGSSENGFDLRAGPTRTGSQKWNPTNGTVITADGHIPMNFNTAGSVTINLGTVPIQAAGGDLAIRKFDTDVGAKSITYTCSALPGLSWPGTLSGDGTFATDTIQVPANYATLGPGVWTASYTAGSGDTSVWDMSYTGSGPGKPGSVKLIR